MNVEFRKSFAQDLRQVKDRNLLGQVKQLIEIVERATNLQEVPSLEKLKRNREHYRIRLRDYRGRASADLALLR